MKRFIKKLMRRIPILRQVLDKPRISHGAAGIKEVGHRQYVGGLWHEIGELQFEFLVRNGLQPHHYLLDIACGSLRGGVHFIPYLERGHYLGIDKEGDLIRAGVQQELGEELFTRKKPQLVVSDAFEFGKFTAKPNFALAQSLFTHMPPRMIHDCFKQLRRAIQEDGVFYATFFETDKVRSNRHCSKESGLRLTVFGISALISALNFRLWRAEHGARKVRPGYNGGNHAC